VQAELAVGVVVPVLDDAVGGEERGRGPVLHVRRGSMTVYDADAQALLVVAHGVDPNRTKSEPSGVWETEASHAASSLYDSAIWRL